MTRSGVFSSVNKDPLVGNYGITVGYLVFVCPSVTFHACISRLLKWLLMAWPRQSTGSRRGGSRASRRLRGVCTRPLADLPPADAHAARSLRLSRERINSTERNTLLFIYRKLLYFFSKMTDDYSVISFLGPVIGLEFNGKDCVQNTEDALNQICDRSLASIYFSSTPEKALHDIDAFYNFVDLSMS